MVIKGKVLDSEKIMFTEERVNLRVVEFLYEMDKLE